MTNMSSVELKKESSNDEHNHIVTAVQKLEFNKNEDTHHKFLKHSTKTSNGNVLHEDSKAKFPGRGKSNLSRHRNCHGLNTAIKPCHIEGSVKEKLDHICEVARTTISNGDLNGLKLLYSHRRVGVIDSYGNSPLHLAAMVGHNNCMKWLLKHSHLRVTVNNDKRETCAHLATKYGQIKNLKSIVYCGTIKPLTIACERDSHGMTCLHLAAILGRNEIVTWLADTFGKTLALIKNNYGQTALHLASAKGHFKCVHPFCKLGPLVANQRDNQGATPALYASQEGHTNCIYYLVHIGKADISYCTDDGVNPLLSAAQAGKVGTVRFLLQLNSNPDISHQTKDRATVFHMAASNGHTDILILLLKHDKNGNIVNLKDVKGSTPAHDAAENGHTESLKLLIASGLDMYMKDEDGETPYSLALRSPSRECATFARSLTDGDVLEYEAIKDVMKNAPSSESLTLNRVSNVLDAQLLSHQEALNFNSGKESNLKHKEKETLFKKFRSKRNSHAFKHEAWEASKKKDEIPNVLCGEFILRSMPENGNHSNHGLSARERRKYKPKRKQKKKNVNLYQQKNRPSPLSLPQVEENLIIRRPREGDESVDIDIEDFYLNGISSRNSFSSSSVSDSRSSCHSSHQYCPSVSHQGVQTDDLDLDMAQYSQIENIIPSGRDEGVYSYTGHIQRQFNSGDEDTNREEHFASMQRSSESKNSKHRLDGRYFSSPNIGFDPISEENSLCDSREELNNTAADWYLAPTNHVENNTQRHWSSGYGTAQDNAMPIYCTTLPLSRKEKCLSDSCLSTISDEPPPLPARPSFSDETFNLNSAPLFNPPPPPPPTSCPPPPPPLPPPNILRSMKIPPPPPGPPPPSMVLSAQQKGNNTEPSRRQARGRNILRGRKKIQQETSRLNPNVKGRKCSPKIEKMKKVLEDSGIMEAYFERMQITSDNPIYSDEDNWNQTAQLASIDPRHRSISPPVARSVSPIELNPNQKFTYLPDGVLKKPRLRSLEREQEAANERRRDSFVDRQRVPTVNETVNCSQNDLSADSDYCDLPEINNDTNHLVFDDASAGSLEQTLEPLVLKNVKPALPRAPPRRSRSRRSLKDSLSQEQEACNKDVSRVVHTEYEKGREENLSELEIIFKKRKLQNELKHKTAELTRTNQKQDNNSRQTNAISRLSLLVDEI